MIKFLFERRGDEIQGTEDVLKAAAGRWTNGKEVMAFILDQHGHKIQLTQDVITTAAENWINGKETMAFLLTDRETSLRSPREW
ncbi:hypothetical protein BDW62DRAFT_196028 [Aspergillus aurantiobrunneus]